MGVKLRLSTGKCACSNCYQTIEPNATFCESCDTMLDGEMEAKSCPSCETLISMEANVCPICNEKVAENPNEAGQPVTTQLAKEDEEFLVKVMSWAKSWDVASPDTEEDVQERERAMKVLESIATIEPDETIEDHIKDIDETSMEKEDFEVRRKQLMKLGKPFETLLERNVANMNIIDKEINDKMEELKKLEGGEGKENEDARNHLERRIKILQKKKQAMISYESNILMIGGAYRSILGAHQNELLRIEADLKKRVDAFQKEVERRKKQKDKLRGREEALDRREEELSHRFLDLKSRENEIRAIEEKILRSQKDLETRQEELKTWESEIESNRNSQAQANVDSTKSNETLKEEWLAAQKQFQADLFKMKDEVIEAEKDMQKIDSLDNDIKNLENNLEEKEKELNTVASKLEELKAMIIEKDKEIEKLKEVGPGFNVDEETRKILKILDDLLELLPEEVVDKFAKSNDYLLYEKVLEKYKL
ncbi:MAG: zinc ribbon domain-containing protein [Thermoplasmata archaeon]|nr:MAG: zinc ribbon domain-containing protein [Thermoplasmata archaeon]